MLDLRVSGGDRERGHGVACVCMCVGGREGREREGRDYISPMTCDSDVKKATP